MAENKNKGLFLGVAAATALVGAALLYHFVFSDDDETEGGAATDITTLLQEAGLDQVQKGRNGQGLEPRYFLKLLQFMAKTGKERRSEEKKEALAARRQHYQDKNWEAYKEIVTQEMMKDDQTMQVVMQDVIGNLPETSDQEFMMTMQMCGQDPQMQQMMMMAQQGKLPGDEQQAESGPRLEKSKTLKAFDSVKKLTMESMQKAQRQQTQGGAGGDQMEQMMEMMVEQAKVEDEIFAQHGVSGEEVEQNIMFYMGQKDPEVTKAMMSFQMEMQKEMQKMGGPGGMGGGPPGMGM